MNNNLPGKGGSEVKTTPSGSGSIFLPYVLASVNNNVSRQENLLRGNFPNQQYHIILKPYTIYNDGTSYYPNQRLLAYANNYCVLPLGNNLVSIVSVVTPDDVIRANPKKYVEKDENFEPPAKKQVYRVRQRKNFDSQSKNRILELYEHYVASNKRMTVRNIASAIVKELKKEKYGYYYTC